MNGRKNSLKGCIDWLSRLGLIELNAESPRSNETEILLNFLKDTNSLLDILRRLNCEISGGNGVSIATNTRGITLKQFSASVKQNLCISDDLLIVENIHWKPSVDLHRVVLLLSKISCSKEAVEASGIQGFIYRRYNSSMEIRCQSDYRRFYGSVRRRLNSQNSCTSNRIRQSLAPNILENLLKSEAKHYQHMQDICQIFMVHMSELFQKETVLKYVTELCAVHEKLQQKLSQINQVDSQLRSTTEWQKSICAAYLSLQKDFLIYCRFAENLDRALSLQESMENDADYRDIFQVCEEKSSLQLGSLGVRLQAPLSWIENYKHWFMYLDVEESEQKIFLKVKEMFIDLSSQLATIQADRNMVIKVNNLKVKLFRLSTKFVDLDDFGRFVMEAEVRIQWIESVAREIRQIYLFEKAIVIAYKRKDRLVYEMPLRYVTVEAATSALLLSFGNNFTEEASAILVTASIDKKALICFKSHTTAEEWLTMMSTSINNRIKDFYSETLIGFQRCLHCHRLLQGAYHHAYRCSKTMAIVDRDCTEKEVLPCQKKEAKLAASLTEFLQTESSYIDTLETVLFIYRPAFINDRNPKIFMEMLTIFQSLYEVHESLLSRLLLATGLQYNVVPDLCSFSQAISDTKTAFLRPYDRYYCLLPTMLEQLSPLALSTSTPASTSAASAQTGTGSASMASVPVTTPQFAEFKACQELSGKFIQHDIRNLLSRPFQRITKYTLMLKVLLGHFPVQSSKEHCAIAEAHTAIEDVLHHFNRTKDDLEWQITFELIMSRLPTPIRGNSCQEYGRLKKEGNIKMTIDNNNNSFLGHIYIFELKILVVSTDEQTVPCPFQAEYLLKNRRINPNIHDYKLAFDVREENQRRKITIFCKNKPTMLEWLTAINDSIDFQYPMARCPQLPNFQVTTFSEPQTCSECHRLLQGRFLQGYCCEDKVCHKQCIPYLVTQMRPQSFTRLNHYSRSSLSSCSPLIISTSFEGFDTGGGDGSTIGDCTGGACGLVERTLSPIHDVEQHTDISNLIHNSIKEIGSVLHSLCELHQSVDLDNIREEQKPSWTILEKIFEAVERLCEGHDRSLPENWSELDLCELYRTVICDQLELYGLFYLELVSNKASLPSALNILANDSVKTLKLLKQPIAIVMSMSSHLEDLATFQSENCQEIDDCFEDIQYSYQFLLHIERDQAMLDYYDVLQSRIAASGQPLKKNLSMFGRLQIEDCVKLKLASETGWKIRNVYLFDKIILLGKQFALGDLAYEKSFHLERKEPELKEKECTLKIFVADYYNADQIILQLPSVNHARVWEAACKLAIRNHFPQQSTMHHFILTSFNKRFEKCISCQRLLLGLFSQGYLCKNTGYVCHQKCISTVRNPCRKGIEVDTSRVMVNCINRKTASYWLRGSPCGTYVVWGTVSTDNDDTSCQNRFTRVCISVVIDNDANLDSSTWTPLHIDILSPTTDNEYDYCRFSSRVTLGADSDRVFDCLLDLIDYFSCNPISGCSSAIQNPNLRLEFKLVNNPPSFFP